MSTQGHQHLEKEAIFSCSQFETVAVLYTLNSCHVQVQLIFLLLLTELLRDIIHCTVCTVRAEFHKNRASVWICVSISGDW